MLLFKVIIEMEGIPPHAWNMATTREILGGSCWIECLDASTENKTDLSKFKLTAWTDDPDAIPVSHKLRAVEPEPTVDHGSADRNLIFGNFTPFL